MSKHTSCCVPLFTNNFRNSTGLTFYRIPKEKSIRREYVRLIRSENLKLESNSTRVCSAHWSGGKKLSRTHLPSIFPWSKEKTERTILSRTESITNASSKKRRVDVFTTERDEGPLLNNENCMQDSDSIPAPSFSDAERSELIKESKRLQQWKIRNLTSQNLGTEMKILNFTLVYPTGMPFCSYMIWSMIRHSALTIVITKKKDTVSVQKLGRPRAMTIFEEFVLTLLRLRLGLFQKDLADRFNVSETTVSVVFNTWIRFIRIELEPLICLPRKEILH